MARGRVKKWNGQTGFIEDADGGGDVFFGDRALAPGVSAAGIRQGLEVEFDRRDAPRGPAARNVRPVGTAAPPSRPAPRGEPRQERRPQRDYSAASAQELREVPLPKSMRDALRPIPVAERHPGLHLDKYLVPCPQQEQQRDVLAEVAGIFGDAQVFADVRERWLGSLHARGVETWERTTLTALTLHLARASALENAGLCLHPVYGFAYLPGSGLKGMTRAYAQTVAGADEGLIAQVFGNEPGEPERDRQRAGDVVFFDAWPTIWPKLFVDIVNNHHPRYYRGEDAPGDWDSPVPVYFLAVREGTIFSFALGKRRADVPDAVLDQTRQWLEGALTHLGCGAKTAAGYGYFASEGDVSLPAGARRLAEEFTLELVTPAFLAGASQQQQDCDLRSATLRGLLRKWWRTLHSGCLARADLASLEAALWGDTQAGGAIQLRLERVAESGVSLYAHHDDWKGLRYLAYGMDEKSRGVRRQRFHLQPGARWKLRVTARATDFFRDRDDVNDSKKKDRGRTIHPAEVMKQARAALWMLTRFGGVGSKARKGFGSLQCDDKPIAGLDAGACRDEGKALREYLDIDRPFDDALAETPSFFDPRVKTEEIAANDNDPSSVLDRVGLTYNAVAGLSKHDPDKRAWGLPRKVHGPMQQPLRHQDPKSHQPPVWLDFPNRLQSSPENARHAAPIHVHVARSGQGLVVRLLTMPVNCLPDRATSVRMLDEFLKHFGTEWNNVGAGTRPRRSLPPGGGRRPLQSAAPSLKAGDVVECELIDEKTKKGGWKARHPGTGLSGPIVNTAEVPADKQVGDNVQLVVASVSQAQIDFRWPKQK